MSKMRTYGGQFAKLLAEAWFAADNNNRQRIETVFTELISEYIRFDK